MPKLRDQRFQTSEIIVKSADGTALVRIPPQLRQQMQYLWTRLEVHDGDVPRSVGLTSQISGEGVSFISRALAAVLARHGRTCLVEANWWGDGLPLSDASEGLAGVLQGSSDLDDVLVATNHPGLWIVPAGDMAVSGGAVASNTEGVGEVLERLHQRFEYTVLDLPAISTSANSLSIAAAADASLLVVRQRVTRLDQVESAVHDLRHTRLLGVVLNCSRISMPKFLQRHLLSER